MGVSFSFDAFACLATRKQQLLTVFLDLESNEPRQLQYNIRNDITKSTYIRKLKALIFGNCLGEIILRGGGDK